ncbi:MAG TPA: methyltransferase domain-containing protein [Candidatus Acidoferrum sp.]|nr:methyltransferase domain-containing protein [Candidatus Acidoferrum sp.]
MTQPFSAAIERIKRLPSGRWLFFRRALAHPLQLGTPIPSSPALGRLIASHLKGCKDGLTVEIGGGTGVITRQLLAAGVPADRLLVLEIDPEMADYLRATLPEANVMTGDARRLATLLPPTWRGQVDTIVSGIPMAVLSAAYQRELVDAMFSVLAPEGRYLQYTFTLGGSPVRARRLGLTGRRLGTTFGNFPPASVWTYRPIAEKA